MSRDVRPRILCLAGSGAAMKPTLQAISASGYDVLLALTTDQGVALCMSQHIAAVVLAAGYLRESEWSVAKSLKLIKPAIPILLLDSRQNQRKSQLPPEIDAVVNLDSPNDLLKQLRKLLAEASNRH